MRERLTRLYAAALTVAVCLAVLTSCSPRGTASGNRTSARPSASMDSTATTSTAGPGAPADAIPFAALDLDIVFTQVQSMDAGGIPIENTLEARGSVRLAVDTSVSPATVRGEGTLPISGGGRVGGVAFTNSGTLSYRFSGTLVRGAGGRLELRLGGQRSMTVTSRPVGPSASTPFEPFERQVFPAEDGYVHRWSWQQSGAGVSGSESWTLRVPAGK